MTVMATGLWTFNSLLRDQSPSTNSTTVWVGDKTFNSLLRDQWTFINRFTVPKNYGFQFSLARSGQTVNQLKHKVSMSLSILSCEIRDFEAW